MEARQMLGKRGLIDRGQFVRLILESLHSLGYADVADALEEESRIPLFLPVYHELGHLIGTGRWRQCIRIIQTKECFKDLLPEKRNKACFFIWRQCFLEQLAFQDTDAGWLNALEILAQCIAPLAQDVSEVRSLGLYLLSSDPSRKLDVIQGRGKLFEDVLHYLGKCVRVPERRLESLVEMASVGQQKSCPFHNMPICEVTLYKDHFCSYETIPLHCSQILNNHRNQVVFLKFSNNGLYLASSSNDWSMIIWQVEENTDKVLMRHNIEGHVRPGPSIAWNPDDTKLLTFGVAKLVVIWDVETGRMDKVIGCDCTLNSLAWFPNSMEFACGSHEPENAVYLFDLAGQIHGRLEGRSMPGVFEIAVTPDGQHLISIYSDSFIRISNLQTGEKMDIREPGSITSLSLSGDGRHLTVNLDHDEIHLWSVRSPCNFPEIYRGHQQANHFTRPCFGGSNSTFIASGSTEDSSIYIWHRGDYDKPVQTLRGHLMAVNSVSWNPTKPHMLASASADHTIRIWMAGAGQRQ